MVYAGGFEPPAFYWECLNVRDINLRLSPVELDFIGTILSNVSFGTVANANMTHLLAKLREQANSPVLNGTTDNDTSELAAN
jgi:hypothetical protein